MWEVTSFLNTSSCRFSHHHMSKLLERSISSCFLLVTWKSSNPFCHATFSSSHLLKSTHLPSFSHLQIHPSCRLLPWNLSMLTSVCLSQEASLDFLLLRHKLCLPPPLPRQTSWKCCQHTSFHTSFPCLPVRPAFPHPGVEGEWSFAQGDGKVWFSVLKFCGVYNIPAQIESCLVSQITWLISPTLDHFAVDSVSPLCDYVTPTMSVRHLCGVLFASSPLLWESSSSLASVLLHS